MKFYTLCLTVEKDWYKCVCNVVVWDKMPKGLIINCSLKGFDYFSSVLKTSLKNWTPLFNKSKINMKYTSNSIDYSYIVFDLFG